MEIRIRIRVPRRSRLVALESGGTGTVRARGGLTVLYLPFGSTGTDTP